MKLENCGRYFRISLGNYPEVFVFAIYQHVNLDILGGAFVLAFYRCLEYKAEEKEAENCLRDFKQHCHLILSYLGTVGCCILFQKDSFSRLWTTLAHLCDTVRPKLDFSYFQNAKMAFNCVAKSNIAVNRISSRRIASGGLARVWPVSWRFSCPVLPCLPSVWQIALPQFNYKLYKIVRSGGIFEDTADRLQTCFQSFTILQS